MVKLCGDGLTCGRDTICVAQQRVADLREPNIVQGLGGLWAYVELAQDEQTPHDCAIYRARIETERRWVIDPPVAVMVPREQDGNCLGAPSVLVDGGSLLMAAERGDGSAIVLARSNDGATFVRDERSAMVPELEWELGRVASPALVRWKGEQVLLYEGGGGIGIARIVKGVGKRTGNDPWLTPSSFEDRNFWRGIESVREPWAVERNGALLVYVAVRGIEGSDATATMGLSYPADVNDSIGLVATRDLRSYERYPSGPVYARRTNLRAYLGEAEPSLYFDQNGTWLVFSGSDATGLQRSGLVLAKTWN